MPYLFVVYYSVAKRLYNIQGSKTMYYLLIGGGQVQAQVTWGSQYFTHYNSIPLINISNFKKKKLLGYII